MSNIMFNKHIIFCQEKNLFKESSCLFKLYFKLEKRKVANMTWQQIYVDHGLKWEVILSQKGPGGNKLYSFRISRGFRGIAYRDGSWLRLLSLHPDHDSAYYQ